MVVNGRPLKRMKRRVTADLNDFLKFPSGDAPLAEAAGGHFHAIGGVVGATTLGVCTILLVASACLSISVDSILEELEAEVIKTKDVINITYLKFNVMLWFSSVAALANILAMVVQHAYTYMTVGPQNLFTRANPASIRWHPLFLELALWTSFIVAEIPLLIGARFFWHGVYDTGVDLSYRKGTCSVSGYVLFFITFLMVGFHIYVVEIQHDIPEENGVAEIQHDIPEENRVRSILTAVHRLPLSVVDKDVDEYDVCSICLDAPTSGEMLRELPCHHTFHPHCIEEWLIRSAICPLCKVDIDIV